MPGKKGHSGRRSEASLYTPPGKRISPQTGEETTDDYTILELCQLQFNLVSQADQVPNDIYRDYKQLLDWLISRRRWSAQQIHMWRWIHGRFGFSEGYRDVDDSVWEYAAKKVAKSPAQGGPAAMKASYHWMEKRWREV
jgi:hypothetical protein